MISITRKTYRAKAMLAAAALTTVTLAVSGCGLTVESLPLPEPGVGGETYTLHAEFENALNLPNQAKVKIGGSDIGVVSKISTKNFQAVIDMQVRKDIQLPKGSVAELRQATPLGDVFVAVVKPTNPSGATLGEGDTITREFTSAGATVEQLLLSVTMLFNGGGLASLSRVGTELGNILGGHGHELGHLTTELTGVLGDLNANSAQIDSVLTEFSTLSATINSKRGELGQVADTLPNAIGAIAENTQALTDMLARLAVTTNALGDYARTNTEQLGTVLDSVTSLSGQLASTGDKLGYLLDQLALLRPGVEQTMKGKGLIPYANLTNLDVPLLTAPGTSRLPNMQDANDFVGTFVQVLLTVQGRLGGHR
ncbi:MCE family protein [Nocardia sp. NPDC058640]|uniref:MCE family protein n=1 Tax=Nocardia sp. NPDC058640 TaxID=3346571 RepID=UPI003664CA11